MRILASKLVSIKVGRGRAYNVWQRENESGGGVFYSGVKESYLSPAAGLPLGTPTASAAPLLAGFGGQMLAVFLRDGAARPGHAAHLAGLEPSSTGGGALQDGKGEKKTSEIEIEKGMFCV